MHPRCTLPLLGFLILSSLAFAQPDAATPVQVTIVFSPTSPNPLLRPQNFLLDQRRVVADPDGSLRLTGSLLVADEMGATDFHQSESLGPQVQVKKIVHLDSPEAKEAELFFFGSAKQVSWNGVVLSTPEKLFSTGWSRVRVPAHLLRQGDNTVLFTGPGQLLVEPSKQPGRSFKSTDGGKTWARDNLTNRGHVEGEYLVRLRLGRHGRSGQVLSNVVDLWPSRDGIAVPGKLKALVAQMPPGSLPQQPASTRLRIFVRTGSTPWPEAKSWTDWESLDQIYNVPAEAARHRWAQLRFDLETASPLTSPRVPASFELLTRFVPDTLPADSLGVKDSSGNPVVLRPGTPFTYQEPSPRLELLRKRYKLDEVIAPGQTEMEQLMLLRYWVRNQWHTAWGNHPAGWMPPWDAHIILEGKDHPDCLTMCTHYAAVFTQCCLALGWNARHCILDHHCVSEVFVNSAGKWVMMDAGNSPQRADVGLHFERNGVPWSARELLLAYHGKKTDGITVHFTPAKLSEKIAHLCRPAPPRQDHLGPRPDVISLAELRKYPVCQIENYRRYAFPNRNNFLSSLVPGELYQGWSEYFYDGYCWVGDDPNLPRHSPEYSHLLSPLREQDVDWKLNWTRIHLSRTAKPDELRVDLETHTPNLLRFEKVDGDRKDACPASFVWQLQPGVNVLRVRSVNRWEKSGSVAWVEVTR